MSEKLLNYTLTGEGEPLILLHGLLGSSKNLRSLARRLAEEYCVCNIDLPNHGDSPSSDDMRFAVMAGQVLAVATELDWQHFHILGHSLGGKVAMRVAIDYPAAVASLIVEDIAPVDYPPHHREMIEALRDIDLAALASRAQAHELLAEVVSDRATRDFILQNLRRDAEGFRWLADLEQIAAEYSVLCGAPLEAGQQFAGPVFFVAGERSNYIAPEHRGAVLEAFPNAKYREIRGAGHDIHADKPELFTAVVKKFLKNNGM